MGCGGWSEVVREGLGVVVLQKLVIARAVILKGQQPCHIINMIKFKSRHHHVHTVACREKFEHEQ